MAKQTTQVGENSTKPTTTNNTCSDSACSSLISLLMQKGMWGIESLYQVMTNNCENIPNDQGIFLFLTTDTECPEFLSEIQQRKRFKYKKGDLSFPTKPTDVKKRWVDGSYILFIGGTEGRKLKERIKKFINFGKGKTDHRCGGWYVWLLKCLCHILVFWIVLPEECGSPIDVRNRMIREFKKQHKDKREEHQPFANTQNVK